MTTTSIPAYVSLVLKKELAKIQRRMLLKISEDYEISFKELLSKYTDDDPLDEGEHVQIVRKREYNKNLQKANQCCALNAKGVQCKRSIIKDTHFCVVHREKQPNGIFFEKSSS